MKRIDKGAANSVGLDVLGGVSAFGACSEQEIREVVPFLEIREYGIGETVFSETDSAAELFIVESGRLELEILGIFVREISPGEAFGEIGMIDNQLRTGTVRTLEASRVLRLPQGALFEETGIPPRIALKIVRALAQQVTTYLRSLEHTTSRAIIQRGESDRVEFKSTLRWNIHAKRFDQAIENASLKTLAAYVNTNGGSLFVGVQDSGEIIGLEADRFPNLDKLLLHLTSLIRDRLGPQHMRFINPRVETLDDRQILRVDCRPGSTPAYLKEGQDESFYIRTGPASTRLRTSQVFDYILRRFRQSPDPGDAGS